jgi:hypothetical protein
MSGRCEIARLARHVRRLGFEIDHTGASHLKWRAPNGAFFYSSSTPSCPFAIHHIRGDIRRLLRAAHERGELLSLNEAEM